MIYVTQKYSAEWKKGQVNEWWIRKDVEGSGRGLI
jgi:hypothetical protein